MDSPAQPKSDEAPADCFRDWAHPLLMALKYLRIADNKLSMSSVTTAYKEQLMLEAEVALVEAKGYINDALATIRAH